MALLLLSFVTDGDLLVFIDRMLHLRGHDTVRITKVKGLVGKSMVLDGRVRVLDELLALDAGGSDFLSLILVVIFLVSVVDGVLLFLIFIGSSLQLPGLLSAGALPKRKRLVHAVRDLAMLPGPPAIWTGDWVNGLVAVIDAEDVAHWPYTLGLLVEWVAFSGSLHWLVGGVDLGVGGVSFVQLLILYELWAGERLILEKAHPRYLVLGRPISVSLFRLVQALIFGALVGSLLL